MTSMLQLSATLLNRPVLSLRTGSPVATTLKPIINPNNLKIEGFYCQDGMDRKKHDILLYQDIRDVIPQGFVVNDYDVLALPEDLVRLRGVLDHDFELLGKQVVTVGGEKLGKVSDFSTEMTTMFVQKIYVSQSVLKNFMGGTLGIERTQIIEITDKKIVVQDLQQTVPARAGAVA